MRPKEIPIEHQELMIKIGMKIRELRKDRGLSYIELAEQVGISRNSYNQIELGISNFQFISLLSILKYHEISISDFFKEI